MAFKINFNFLRNIFAPITHTHNKEDITPTPLDPTEVQDNLVSYKTNKPLSGYQGQVLQDNKIGTEDVYYVPATVTYEDESTGTLNLLVLDSNNRIRKDGFQNYLVRVIWLDSQAQEGTRPDSVSVDFSVNGNVTDTQILTEQDNWKYLFKNIDESANVAVRVNSINQYSPRYVQIDNVFLIELRFLTPRPPMP